MQTPEAIKKRLVHFNENSENLMHGKKLQTKSKSHCNTHYKQKVSLSK